MDAPGTLGSLKKVPTLNRPTIEGYSSKGTDGVVTFCKKTSAGVQRHLSRCPQESRRIEPAMILLPETVSDIRGITLQQRPERRGIR
jgi:hypothetical protein